MITVLAPSSALQIRLFWFPAELGYPLSNVDLNEVSYWERDFADIPADQKGSGAGIYTPELGALTMNLLAYDLTSILL